jgi:hypothetical protein
MPLPAAVLSELEQAAGRNGYPADPVENGDPGGHEMIQPKLPE